VLGGQEWFDQNGAELVLSDTVFCAWPSSARNLLSSIAASSLHSERGTRQLSVFWACSFERSFTLIYMELNSFSFNSQLIQKYVHIWNERGGSTTVRGVGEEDGEREKER